MRPFKSDTLGKVSNLELSFSARSLRMKMINLDLVSMPEIEGDFFLISSRSQKSLVSSQCARLNRRNSRLEVEKVTLVDLWFEWLGWSRLSELYFTQGKQVGHCSVSMFWVVRCLGKLGWFGQLICLFGWMVSVVKLVKWLGCWNQVVRM